MTEFIPGNDDGDDPEPNVEAASEELRHAIRKALSTDLISPEKTDEVVDSIVKALSLELVTVRTVSRKSHTRFSGPLPPPRAMAEYDDVLPGLPERIVRMWEQEQTGRLETIHANLENERIGQRDRNHLSWAGLVAGFILAAICVIGGIYLAAIGASVAGFAAILGPLAALTAVFITGSIVKGKRDRSSDASDSRKE